MSGFTLNDNATAEGLLDHQWTNLMDDCSPTATAFAKGVVEALRYMDFISGIEAEAWNARMERCPGLEDGHYGGRRWCAFCGDIDEDGEPIKKASKP